VPPVAEDILVVRLLDDRGDVRITLDAFRERVITRVAELSADAHHVLEREILATDRDHVVLEKRATQLRPHRAVVPLLEIRAVDLRAERARDRPHVHRLVIHALRRSIRDMRR
jgi:hypothetical protein